MSKTALLATTVFLLAVVVVVLVLRQAPVSLSAVQPVSHPTASTSTPPPSTAPAGVTPGPAAPAGVTPGPAPGTAPAALTPEPGDDALAKDSTDSTIVGFLSSFRSSSETSCRSSATATLKTDVTPEVSARISAVCSCASDHAVATLTVGDVRGAMLSTFAADRSSSPVVQRLQASYVEAEKTCLTNDAAH